MRVAILAGELEARVDEVHRQVAVFPQLRSRRHGEDESVLVSMSVLLTGCYCVSRTANDTKLTTSYSTAGANSTWSDRSLQIHTI